MREFEEIAQEERLMWEKKEKLSFDDVLYLGARRKELEDNLTNLKDVVE